MAHSTQADASPPSCGLRPVVPKRGSGTIDELCAEPFPRMLMLQTTSACNAGCVFCPLPDLRKTAPQGRMDPALLERIVVEAGRYPDVACINLFLMNEPLCDRRLPGFLDLAHRHNPRAQISLWTNAVALSAEVTDTLLRSSLTSLGVSLHAHNPRTWRRITGRSDFVRVLGRLVHFVEQRNARRPDLEIVLRYVGAEQFMTEGEQRQAEAFWADADVTLDIDPGFLSRAGNLDAPAAIREPHKWLAGCQALGGPKQAHVLFTGQVVLCCMDYGRTTFLGDANEQSIHDIWTGPRRRRLLEMLYGQRPADPDFICARCELAIPR